MENKYRFQWYIYLISWVIPMLILIVQVMTRPNIKTTYHDTMTVIFVVATIIWPIISLFSYYKATDKGLQKYSLFKKTEFRWDEMEHIVLEPNKKCIGILVSVSILAKGRKIFITNWTKNYKELLTYVIAHKKDSEGIDRKVLEILL